MRFGISSHLYHDQQLSQEHLTQIASYGFDALEVFATRSHFDYRDPAAIASLRRWLHDTGISLHGIHAPIAESATGGRFSGTYSVASKDNAARQQAVREVESALAIAREIECAVLVVHLGLPSTQTGASDNSRAAAARSLEEIIRLTEALKTRVMVEVIQNDLSSVSTLVTMLERDFEGTDAGICMDFGHAHLMGDLPDAIETAAEHLLTTHVHDNRGREDDHLVPYRGTIDWPAALVTMRKIGYDGTYLMELANTGTPSAVLEEARRARQKMERGLAD
ncbi:MAG: sugar phosphate isomerase/epimerase family protein [Vicinamibacterales bacterium]